MFSRCMASVQIWYRLVCFQVPTERGKLFDLQLPIKMFRTCFKRREGGRRAMVFICIIAVAFCTLILRGESQVFFLFTRYQFHWTLQDFTLFYSELMIITTVGKSLVLSMPKNGSEFSDGELRPERRSLENEKTPENLVLVSAILYKN